MFKTPVGFSKALDRATSNLLIEPDWDAILSICDMLRQSDVAPKPAYEAIKKKLQDKNPHTVLYALQVLDAIVKNCGKPVHDEVITMSSMQELVTMLKKSPDDVRNRILEVLQCWAHGFRDKPQYRCVEDTINVLKMDGLKFPAMKESDALFVAESAPDWVDGEVCHRCRDKFGLTTRKHHCRNCGQIFCSKCSSKVSALPKYGIEKEVRVCDTCYDALNTRTSTSAVKKKENRESEENGLPVEYVNSPLAKESQTAPKKTEQEIQEEEELQLALAISQSEAEAKSKNNQSKSSWASSVPKQSIEKPIEPQYPQSNGTGNSDLDRYLNRQFWENKQKETVGSIQISAPQEPSAPTPSSTPSTIIATSPTNVRGSVSESYQNGESDEIHQFMAALKSQLNVFTNRMRSNVNRRRPLVNDPTVISMFNSLLPMRQQLLEYSQAQDHWKEYYERLQEKLTRLKEAREALDVLREEHNEKIRVEAEEKHRAMQVQMMAKLDALRLKKREYLEIQRQVAFQQMQAQEAEMQRRKQMYQPYAFVPGPYAMGGAIQGGIVRPMPGAASGYQGGMATMGPQGYANVPPYQSPGQPTYQMPQPQNVPMNYYNAPVAQHYQQHIPAAPEYQHPAPPVGPGPYSGPVQPGHHASAYIPPSQAPHMAPVQMSMPHPGYQNIPPAYQNMPPPQNYYAPPPPQQQQVAPTHQEQATGPNQPPTAAAPVDEGPLISFD